MAKKKSYAVPALLAAAGVGAFLLYSRSAKAAGPLGDLPQGPGDDPTSPGAPSKPSKPKKGNAPPFPSGITKAMINQFALNEWTQWATLLSNMSDASGSAAIGPADIAAARGAEGIPSSQSTADYLSDQAFNQMFPGVGKIGKGTSWKPFVDTWLSLRSHLRKQEWVEG